MAGEGNWYDLRVYVGNIGRYNEGSLVGGWATLPMGRDDLDAFLRDRVGIDGERYEEYRIDDFDLPDWLPAGPGERVVDERTSLEDLNVMAGVLSTLDEDDAAKARIWIEEGMSPAGRLSPLVFANVALQADDIPFYAYEAGTRFDPGISSNEEAFALTAAENDPELAEALDGRFGPYLNLEAIGRDLAMDCTLHDDGYLDRSVDPGIDPELYDAAYVDGAGHFKRILHVTLPGILPVVSLMLLLRVGNILQAGSDQILAMYNASVYSTADVLQTYIYRVSLGKLDFSTGTALGIFESVVGFVMLVSCNAVSRKTTGRSLW